MTTPCPDAVSHMTEPCLPFLGSPGHGAVPQVSCTTRALELRLRVIWQSYEKRLYRRCLRYENEIQHPAEAGLTATRSKGQDVTYITVI